MVTIEEVIDKHGGMELPEENSYIFDTPKVALEVINILKANNYEGKEFVQMQDVIVIKDIEKS